MPVVSHILVVDDEERIRTMLRRYLLDEGFTVSLAAGGVELRGALEKQPVDLVLLDLMMPGEDGLSLIRVVRQKYPDVPIIMLTGKSDVIDRVAALESGADDYIAKPFHLREVLARIRTVLRRARPAGAGPVAAAPDQHAEKLSFQGWLLDTVKRELRDPGGNPVALTSSEFDLLQAFARSPNRVLNRDQLMDLAKGREWAANDRAVDTQIVRLRRKIEHDSKAPELIKTVRGAGYIFTAAVCKA